MNLAHPFLPFLNTTHIKRGKDTEPAAVFGGYWQRDLKTA
jgi:hypothetical protein